MINCNGQKRCGCQDRGLITQYPCGNNSECPSPDPCPETFDAQCAVYTGDTIYDETTGITIENGERVSNIIQRLFSMITGVGCLEPTDPCSSVLNLRSTSVAATNMTIRWDIPSTAPNAYQVYYKKTTDLLWATSSVLVAGTYTYQLIGLTADTEYMIKVNSVCGGDACYSLTIKVTTNPA